MDEKVVPAHQLKVLSIVGFGGLGKTTLANEIYRKLGNQFQCRAFVSVSQKPNIGKILRTILSELGFRAPMDSNFEIWGESELISALKSFLVDKSHKQNNLKGYWEYIRNSLGVLGANFEVNPSLEGMRRILNLSYINLPHYLKACMVYLGIYPEDHTIEKIDLARQWVAEGFISKCHGIDPEDMATSYFNELINRSMIEPSYTSCNGEVISCRVHDMMLDLILHISRQDNFMTVVDDMQHLAGQRDKIRRLSVNLVGARDARGPGSVQLSQTRTLAIFGITLQLLPFLVEFKHLRVLIIEDGSRGGFLLPLLDLNVICHLFQLRYIRIMSRFHRVVLPRKIGALRQLETFEMDAEIESSDGHFCPKLPSDIVHMNQLMHLIVPSTIVLPSGIGNMKSLHTLFNFNLENSKDNFKGLRQLTNLTYLQISCDKPYTITSNDEKAARCRDVLRTCLEKLCNLKFLVMDVLEGDVGIIAQLPSLISVCMKIHGRPKEKIIIRGIGFPVLKSFAATCSRITYLVFEAGAMPKLESLVLKFNVTRWDRAGAAPSGVEHLSRLKEISARIGEYDAKESNIRAAESALRNLACMHPAHPKVIIDTVGGYIKFDEPDVGDEDAEGSCHSTS
uniref:Uncharacterized protein n=1 Tax=Leersia perrieri TaxID=77586 RepID=A0A0D9X0L3_9ORYZ